MVSAVERTEEFQTVYNLRIADHHTYFVGCHEWGFSLWAHNAYLKRVEVDVDGETRYVIKAGNRYVTPDGRLVNPAELGTGYAGARVFKSRSGADAFVKKVNAQRDALEAGLVGKGKLSKKVFGDMFSRHGGLEGKLDFKAFYLDLVSAPSNGVKGARHGRTSMKWEKAARATLDARKEFGWALPNKAKAEQWQKHQKAVTADLRANAKAGQMVGEQVELHVTQGGRTVRTIADNVVRDSTNATVGDAKFSRTVDLSGKSGSSLRSTLTGRQQEAWEMIASHSKSPATVEVGKNAASIGLKPGDKLDAAKISLMFYVSDKKGGVVPKPY